MKELMISVTGMRCQSCKATIEKKLSTHKGVENVSVSVLRESVVLSYNPDDTNPKEITHIIENAGYSVVDMENEEQLDAHTSMEHHTVMAHKGWVVFLNLLLSLSMMYIAMVTQNSITIYFQIIIATWIMFSNRSTLYAGLRGLKNYHPNMYSLIFLGAGAGYLYSLILAIIAILAGDFSVHNLFFETTSAVLSFLAVGDFLQKKGTDRIKRNLGDMNVDVPKYVQVLINESEEKIPISQVKVGDRILVKPGDMIPLDGILLSSQAELIETLLTGELVPVQKQTGDTIISGTYSHKQSLEIEVTTLYKDSFFYKMKSSLTNIEQEKTPILQLVDKMSYYFVPSIIVISFIAFLSWGIFGDSWVVALQIAMTVLVVACPCALGLATPLALSVFFGTAFKSGFLVKNSRILHIGEKIDTCLLDKTGTLTSGYLTIAEWAIEHTHQLDSYIYSIETHSQHPYGQAIIKYLKENCSPELKIVENFKIHEGVGIEGTIGTEKIFIGNSSLMNLSPAEIEVQKLATTLGKTLIWVSINKQTKGYIVLEDVLRTGVAQWLSFAKSKHFQTYIVSGDNPLTVEFLAKTLDIQNYQGHMKPFDKLEKVKFLQSQGKTVLMIGDGLNDSLVLAKADLSLTMGNTYSLAAHSGDVVALVEDISLFSNLLLFAKKTKGIIAQNLFWAFIYNIIMLPISLGLLTLFGGGFITPMMAAVAMSLSSLIVVINSLRLLRFKV